MAGLNPANSLTQETLESLASELGQALSARGWKLACAESCTGGWVAQACTAVAGSSAWFDRGFVTYSNTAKQSLLHVTEAQLLSIGAVSLEVARSMAEGALANSAADVALAITGIAGPGGGSADKPVGTVCFAWAMRDTPTRTDRCQFEGDRRAVRAQSVAHALRKMKHLVG